MRPYFIRNGSDQLTPINHNIVPPILLITVIHLEYRLQREDNLGWTVVWFQPNISGVSMVKYDVKVQIV